LAVEGSKTQDIRRQSGVDLNQEMDYQWREWRAQRIAWAVFILILLAALLGVFGQGPLSHAHAGEAGSPVALDYERFDRYNAPTEMTFRLAPNVGQSGKVRIALSRSFIERIAIDEIVPEPQSVETGADSVTYEFEVQEPSQPALIRYHFEYERAGTVKGEARLEDGPTLAFSIFVWP
jgi:hypothetical protein